MRPLRVELGEFSPKVVGWLGVVFWSMCCVGCAATGPLWGVIEFACFLALSVYLVIADYPNEIMADSEGVWATTNRRRYEIKWSEMNKIEFAAHAKSDMSHSGAVIFHGPDKRLALPGPANWKPEGRAAMVDFIESQAQAWDIPQEKSRRASFGTCKNTKISGNTRRPPLSQ